MTQNIIIINKILKDGMSYCICRAAPHHVPALNAIELAAATIFPPAFFPQHILEERVPLDVLLKAQQEQMLWLAVDAHDKAVGYLLLQTVDGLALLAQLDVHPQHGRQGLGTALVEQALMQVREMGFTACYLTTFSHIAWNAPFYEKFAFKIVAEQELPPAIARILHEERARGLCDRVAMRVCFPVSSPHYTRTT